MALPRCIEGLADFAKPILDLMCLHSGEGDIDDWRASEYHKVYPSDSFCPTMEYCTYNAPHPTLGRLNKPITKSWYYLCSLIFSKNATVSACFHIPQQKKF